MAANVDEQSEKPTEADASPAAKVEAEKKREIKGGLPYSTSPGAFKKALEAIIVAERPERFSGDFMSTILKVSGGSARPIPPMLKKMAFLTSEGVPTDLYSKFKSDSARGQSALDGLRAAFGEMFKKNEFIYRADGNTVRDLIVEITGLKKSDTIVRMIFQTFEAIRHFVDQSAAPNNDRSAATTAYDDLTERPSLEPTAGHRRGGLGLSYHINVVLPESENIAVFNAIFRSLKENLL